MNHFVQLTVLAIVLCSNHIKSELSECCEKFTYLRNGSIEIYEFAGPINDLLHLEVENEAYSNDNLIVTTSSYLYLLKQANSNSTNEETHLVLSDCVPISGEIRILTEISFRNFSGVLVCSAPDDPSATENCLHFYVGDSKFELKGQFGLDIRPSCSVLNHAHQRDTLLLICEPEKVKSNDNQVSNETTSNETDDASSVGDRDDDDALQSTQPNGHQTNETYQSNSTEIDSIYIVSLTFDFTLNKLRISDDDGQVIKLDRSLVRNYTSDVLYKFDLDTYPDENQSNDAPNSSYYYAFVIKREQVNDRELGTKLGRLCLNDESFGSYMELSLSCRDPNTNELYTYGRTVQLDQFYLYVAFNRYNETHRTVDESKGTILCSFERDELNELYLNMTMKCNDGETDDVRLMNYYYSGDKTSDFEIVTNEPSMNATEPTTESTDELDSDELSDELADESEDKKPEESIDNLNTKCRKVEEVNPYCSNRSANAFIESNSSQEGKFLNKFEDEIVISMKMSTIDDREEQVLFLDTNNDRTFELTKNSTLDTFLVRERERESDELVAMGAAYNKYLYFKTNQYLIRYPENATDVDTVNLNWTAISGNAGEINSTNCYDEQDLVETNSSFIESNPIWDEHGLQAILGLIIIVAMILVVLIFFELIKIQALRRRILFTGQ